MLPQLVALDLSPERPVRTSCSPPWRPVPGEVGADMHYALEFGVVISGDLHRNHGHGWFHVGVGQAWATASLEMHQWRVGRRMRYVVFQCLPSLLSQLPALDGLDLSAPFRTPARLAAIGRSPDFRRSLADLARGLLPKYQGAVSPGETFMDMLRLLDPISAEVLRRSGPTAPHPPSAPASSVAPAVSLAQRTTDRIVAVDEAAEACGMSRRTFCRAFKGTMGISFAEFSLRWRLVCAAGALRSGSDAIKAIAHRFGFHGASHFHQAFTSRYSMGPSRYRASPHPPVL